MAPIWEKVANWQPFVKQAINLIKNKTEVLGNRIRVELKGFWTQANKKNSISSFCFYPMIS